MGMDGLLRDVLCCQLPGPCQPSKHEQDQRQRSIEVPRAARGQSCKIKGGHFLVKHIYPGHIKRFKNLAGAGHCAKSQRQRGDEDCAGQPAQNADGFTHQDELDQRTAAQGCDNHECRQPGGGQLVGDRMWGAENDLARIEALFTTAQSAQDQDRPDPGDDQKDTCHFEFGDHLGDHQPACDNIPPPALTFQE